MDKTNSSKKKSTAKTSEPKETKQAAPKPFFATTLIKDDLEKIARGTSKLVALAKSKRENTPTTQKVIRVNELIGQAIRVLS